MKIRIRGNSIRLRLTKTEVENFCATGKILETTQFGDKQLTYTLGTKSDIATPQAYFSGETISVYLQEEARRTWANSNRVGYSNHEDWNDEGVLSILVEKDFTCLDNTIEDQSDNYPNPRL